MQQLQHSAGTFHRILKLARNIVDLEGAPDIATQHRAAAVQYRPRKEMQERSSAYAKGNAYTGFSNVGVISIRLPHHAPPTRSGCMGQSVHQPDEV